MPHGFTTACGLITFNLDDDGEDGSLDALPGYQASTMAVVLGQLALWGFEPMDEDEVEPQLLPNGGVRIPCALVWNPREELEACA